MISNFRIKNLRESHSLTQEQISKKFKVKRKSYSDYEIQRVVIPISLLVSLANFYHVSVGYLCGTTDVKDSYPNILPFDNERMFQLFKELRIRHGYTQKELANLLLCGHNTISQYETGKRTIPLEILISLANLYSLPLDYIIGIIEIKSKVLV